LRKAYSFLATVNGGPEQIPRVIEEHKTKENVLSLSVGIGLYVFCKNTYNPMPKHYH
jgi:hypothetical protein